jgi:hypothetical protein
MLPPSWREKMIGLKRDALTGQVGDVVRVEIDGDGQEVVRLRFAGGVEVTRLPIQVFEFHDHTTDQTAE